MIFTLVFEYIKRGCWKKDDESGAVQNVNPMKMAAFVPLCWHNKPCKKDAITTTGPLLNDEDRRKQGYMCDQKKSDLCDYCVVVGNYDAPFSAIPFEHWQKLGITLGRATLPDHMPTDESLEINDNMYKFGLLIWAQMLYSAMVNVNAREELASGTAPIFPGGRPRARDEGMETGEESSKKETAITDLMLLQWHRHLNTKANREHGFTATDLGSKLFKSLGGTGTQRKENWKIISALSEFQLYFQKMDGVRNGDRYVPLESKKPAEQSSKSNDPKADF